MKNEKCGCCCPLIFHSSFCIFHFYEHFVFLGAEERALFYGDALHVFEDADRVDAVDEDDGVAGAHGDFAELLAFVVIKIDRDDAALDDEHLLQVGDLAREWLVIVRRLDEAGFVGKQAELKRGLGGREERRDVDARIRPDDLGVAGAVVFDGF
jgi:hypothetical protein